MNTIRIALKDLEQNTGQIPGLQANPRQWTKTEIDQIARSLKETPELFEARPIIVIPSGGKYVILGGNLRYEGCKKNKDKDAPCFVLPEDTPVTKMQEVVIKDNGSFGEWDYDALANLWGDLPLNDWGVPAWDAQESGFHAQGEAQEDEFDEDTDQVETRCQTGDIWQLGGHRLMCGDSTDLETVKKLTGGGMIDLLMTDPPYGISADKMTMGTGKQTYERGEWDDSRPDIAPMLGYAKNACIWGGNYFTDVLPVTNDWLCWHKNNDGLSFSEFELAWTNFGRNCRHITHHWGGEKKLHITMKPVEVIAWAIRQTKEECHTILDLFGGSGTTIIASEQLGRKCYMMELDPHFCDVILARWEKLTGKEAKKIN